MWARKILPALVLYFVAVAPSHAQVSQSCIGNLPGRSILNGASSTVFAKYQNNCGACAIVNARQSHCMNNVDRGIRLGPGGVGEVGFPYNPYCGNSVIQIISVKPC